jgi:SAM-dependent methyltransferase
MRNGISPYVPPGAETWDGLTNQGALAGAEHYNRWIVDQVRPWAGRRILDAGCAVGNVTRYWLDRDLVVAIELLDGFVRRVRDRLGGYPNFRVFQYDLADERVRGLASFRFDTVTCFNVLEHVEADERGLANFHALLRPGGHLLLLVPAGRWLYGTLDAAENHRRRYRREELRAKALRAGFRIVRLIYMNFPGVFGWFVNGRILRRRTLPERQLALYDRVVPWVAAVERVFPPLVGQSLLLVARKD